MHAPRILLAALVALALSSACGGDGGVTPDPGPGPGPGPDPAPVGIVYRTPPPAGKLPWPHHSPEWEADQYSRVMNNLFIVNNFGLMQASPGGASAYLHSGLDVVLPNGSPIYAVHGGTVVAEIGGNEFYRTLIVEDEARRGQG